MSDIITLSCEGTLTKRNTVLYLAATPPVAHVVAPPPPSPPPPPSSCAPPVPSPSPPATLPTSTLPLPLPRAPRGVVVFFPGDVQTFERELDVAQYPECAHYSLEASARLLAARFPAHAVLVVRPARFSQNQSEYDYLLRAGQTLLHLDALVCNACAQAGLDGTRLPRTFVGFSKGCLVLWSLLAEWADAQQLRERLLHEPERERAISQHTLVRTAATCSPASASSSSSSSSKPATAPSTPVPPPFASPFSTNAYFSDWETHEAGARLPCFEPSQRIARQRVLVNGSAFAGVAARATLERTVALCTALHVVDGHRFPTNAALVRSFVAFARRCRSPLPPPHVFLHATPRQQQDPRRSYIAAERTAFCALLDRADYAQHYSYTLYFADERRSMRMHFAALDVFATHVDAATATVKQSDRYTAAAAQPDVLNIARVAVSPPSSPLKARSHCTTEPSAQ